MSDKSDVLSRLYAVVLDRKAHPSPDSYVTKLLEKGEDKILQKVGEEAVEVLLAAKSGDAGALVYELADLAFHALVLLGSRDIPPERVAAELNRRFGTSGIAEKAARKPECDPPSMMDNSSMTITRLRDRSCFSPEKASKVAIAEGTHARVALWCLEPGQHIHPHVHEGDHAWTVVQGEGWFLTAEGEHAVSAGSFVFAPEGEGHGMRAKTRLVFVSVSAG